MRIWILLASNVLIYPQFWQLMEGRDRFQTQQSTKPVLWIQIRQDLNYSAGPGSYHWFVHTTDAVKKIVIINLQKIIYY